MKGTRIIVLTLLSIFLAICFYACGGGGGDGVTPTPTPTECVNIAGTWNTTEDVDGTDCGSGQYLHRNTEWM
jgi:hypothetical protein